MRRIERILPEAFAQKEMLRQARAHRVLKGWHKAVGRQLAEKSWPDRFENGVAYVATTGSAWAQELRMRKDQILLRLNELAGEAALFTDLRFGVRNLPPESERAIGQEPAPREPKPNRTIKEIAEKWFGSPGDGSEERA